ncbi:Hpt domain-containing protein [Sansalvadorimonas verongulae]|uniref:Hpt domain-containing protein n=1 Tax=Sansalvadorimonas verongulae TaxID=2172824 RepID=UPI0012BB5045|nr:Hpt domain-containing protein [Sansalvadorimonas verongulae]MTI12741.1 Hpt domain-containing protein [Sansalvadorimonas verongulae]
MEPVDFSVLDEFKELMGDEGEEEVKELVTLYLEDAPNQLAILKDSLVDGDVESFKRAAHSFKSSCGNIGAMGLQALCLDMEQKAIAGGLGTDCEPMLSQAISGFEDVKTALNGYLGA